MWAEERRKKQEANRKTAKWAQQKKTLLQPFKEIRVAGSDAQAKVLKLLREVYNYAFEKEHVPKNPAHARFLGRVFKSSKPLIDPLISDTVHPHAYNTWKKLWDKFVDENGFSGIRPYALRHTYATLNLANGENIKTVSALMGHAGPSYTLDLYAGYVPNTGLGIGTRCMNLLRAAI